MFNMSLQSPGEVRPSMTRGLVGEARCDKQPSGRLHVTFVLSSGYDCLQNGLLDRELPLFTQTRNLLP
jgi:hypothetical protein